MTSALRIRILITSLVLATVAIGGVALRSAGPSPAVAVRTASASSASETTPTLPADVVDPTTSTSVLDDGPAWSKDDVVIAGREGGLTPPTTPTSIKSVPETPMTNMHGRQPIATLRSATGSVTGISTTYCWRSSETQALCACGPGWVDPEDSINAQPGENLHVSFDRDDRPRTAAYTVSDSYDGDSLDAEHIADGQIPMPTRPGTYWVQTSTFWPEGDVLHVFKVNVIGTHEAAAKGSILGAMNGNPEYSTFRLTGPAGRTIEVKADNMGHYRFNNLPAGTYELEGDITNFATTTTGPDGKVTTIASSRWMDVRTIELTAGEIHREDWGIDS